MVHKKVAPRERKRLWRVNSCASAFVKAELQPSACAQLSIHKSACGSNPFTHTDGGVAESWRWSQQSRLKSDTSSYLGHCVSLHVSGRRTEIQRDISVYWSTQCGREQKRCKHEASEYKDQPGQSSWCARGLIFMPLKAARPGSTMQQHLIRCKCM